MYQRFGWTKFPRPTGGEDGSGRRDAVAESLAGD
jgi:hypothetical protein